MFYLVNDARKFLLGYIEQDSTEVMILEGTTEKGVCTKQQMVCETAQEAWKSLCSIVCRYRSEGFSQRDFVGINNFVPPQNLYTEVFPVEFTGVHVRFSELSDAQFQSGAKRLNEIHAALGKKAAGVRLTITDTSIEIKSKGAAVKVNKLSSAAWETMPARAQDLFADRKFIDSKTLLPSGEGNWWFGTQGGLMDLYLRAFLGEAWNSGARFTASGGDAWQFLPKKPFDVAAVSSMQWCIDDPSLIKTLEKAGLLGGVSLTVAPAPRKTGFEFFL